MLKTVQLHEALARHQRQFGPARQWGRRVAGVLVMLVGLPILVLGISFAVFVLPVEFARASQADSLLDTWKGVAVGSAVSASAACALFLIWLAAPNPQRQLLLRVTDRFMERQDGTAGTPWESFAQL